METFELRSFHMDTVSYREETKAAKKDIVTAGLKTFVIRNRFTKKPIFSVELKQNIKMGKVAWMAIEAGNSLAHADLSNTDLSKTDLSNATLRDADLSGANLTDTNLMYANLYGANMRDAKLMGANLSRAILATADLTGANLTGVVGYEEEI